MFWKQHYFWFQHRQLIMHIYDLQSPRRLQDVPNERVHGLVGKMPAQTWGYLILQYSSSKKYCLNLCIKRHFSAFRGEMGRRRNYFRAYLPYTFSIYFNPVFRDCAFPPLLFPILVNLEVDSA